MKARLVIAAAFLAVAVTPLRAYTITVTSTADNGPGSLRDALASAADGDTIDASGVSGTILLTNGELLVTNSVDIVGPGPDLLAVNGYRRSCVFHVTSNAVVSISSLTITNGHPFSHSSRSGGGIYNDQATLIVSNCTLSGNSGQDRGGAIYNDGETGPATLTVINSTLSGNNVIGDGGGGIYNNAFYRGATVTVVNSTLNGNSTDSDGGGIFNYGGHAQIVNSTLNGNSASWGGGIANVYGLLIVSNSTVDGNFAGEDGGGIHNETATLQIFNSTLSSNSTSLYGRGGGIFNYADLGSYADVRVVNSTLSGNSATNGAGIFYNGRGDGPTSMEIGSTILNAGPSGRTITNISGTVTSLGYNLSSDDGGGFLTATGDQINADPMLDPAGLQDNGGPTLTIALLCGSPAIDQGTNFSGAPTDQRGNGFVRTFDDCAVPNAPGGDGTDIGAFEVQRGDCPHPPIITCPTNQSVNARSPAGARVTFPTPAASNGCPVSVVCNPASGSLFAIGDTTVSCIATDSEGNEATCGFTVHLKGAAEQINDLIGLVRALNLKPLPTCILTAELQSASNALRRGNTRVACGSLDAFIFEVNVQAWWRQIWPASRARLLIRHAQRIQSVLGCHDDFGRGHF